jgi:glycosyltransferase involved in cell wall biosynthesis
MRIVLTMNLPYNPAHGGANKANRALAEMLSRRSHLVRAIVPAANANCEGPTENSGAYDKARQYTASHCKINGVEVHAVNGPVWAIKRYLADHLTDFRPDCILVSSEDPMQLLLDAAIKHDANRVIYLAHTPGCLPFGPLSFDKGDRRALLLHRAAAVLAVSRFCADYIREWSTLIPLQAYLPVFGKPPFPCYGRFGSGYVTMINPCKYKGIDIFLALARSFPQTKFAGVASWGTTRADRIRMLSLPNIRIMESTSDIDAIYKNTQILLFPSLCLESFSLTIIEAMLRGIPVVASDTGGISEAMLGNNFLLPVLPIQAFTELWDENKLRIPVVAPQDILPWCEVLSKLLEEEAVYVSESKMAKEAAESFVATLHIRSIEDIIKRVVKRAQELEKLEC